MIQPGELRKGNYMLMPGGHYVKVKSTDQNGFFTESPLNIYVDGYLGEYWPYDSDIIARAPITPKTLEKVKSGQLFKIQSSITTVVLEERRQGNIIVEAWGMKVKATGKPLRYVHELQNFYFDVTGEELKINL